VLARAKPFNYDLTQQKVVRPEVRTIGKFVHYPLYTNDMLVRE
jgi:hypothetical protein